MLESLLPAGLLLGEALLVKTLLFFEFEAACVILLLQFQASLIFCSQVLLALKFVGFQATLTLEFICLSLETILFEFSRTLLFSCLGSKLSALLRLFFKTSSLAFLLLLTQSFLTVESLFAKAQFLLVSLGLQSLLLLLLALIELSKLSLDFLFMIFSFALHTSLLLLDSLLASCFLSLVLETILLVHARKLFLTRCFVFLSLALSIGLFFRKTLTCGFKFSHSS